MNNRNRNKFARLYFVGILIVLIVIAYSFTKDMVRSDYGYSNYLQDLKDGNIESLTIKQNKEVPTGKLVIKLKSGSTKVVYVSDVNLSLIHISEPTRH